MHTGSSHSPIGTLARFANFISTPPSPSMGEGESGSDPFSKERAPCSGRQKARSAIVQLLFFVMLWQTIVPSAMATGEAARMAFQAMAAATNQPSDDTSAEVIAETRTQTQRPPVIAAVVPNRAGVGASVMIQGRRFDRRGPKRNVVRFAKQGGGQTVAVVTTATRTRLTVIVPADTTTGRVSIETRRGTATSPTDFEVIVPLITDFTPNSGAIGASVTLTGTDLKAETGETTVTFAGANGARVSAQVTSSSSTEVRATVPNGAVTGTLELTNTFGRAATGAPFTVTPSQDFKITAMPTSAQAVQNTTATYLLSLTSEQPNFTALAKLATADLPPGVKASFEPQQITVGGSSTLTLDLSGSGVAPGTYPFRVTATAMVDGKDTVREVMPSLTVLPGGQTTLSGRVLSADNEPILGATVSLDGQTATTDAAGNFLLTGIMAGENRPVMVDGRTASAPNRTYPVIAEPATIVAGQPNTVPYVFHLPTIDIQFEIPVVPSQETVVTTPRLPELKTTIPPGANLRNRDGTPVARVSMSMVPVDRTPAPLPPNLSAKMVYTDQPGGAVSDIAMPVVYPNLSGADPGTRVELYSFNHDTVVWERYGFGRVSADGRITEPEIDPATGRPYGLRDFAWHFPASAPSGNPGGDRKSCPLNRGPKNGQVDYSTGMEIEEVTDISFGGARGGLTLTRTYTSAIALRGIRGRFGIGTKDNYDIRLGGTFQAGGAGRVIGPDEGTGRPFNYVRTDPDGTLVFASTEMISQLGDEMRRLPNGTFEYRGKTGERMRFDSSGRLTALVDRNNNTTTLTYTGANLTLVTDPVGRSLKFDYDGQGRVIRVTDPIERSWHYAYDGSGLLAFVTDPLGNTTQYQYSGLRLTAVIDGRNNPAKRIEYDSGDRVIKQTFADGGFEQYRYTLSGTTITSVAITDSLGRTLTKRFNAVGYVIEEIDELGQKSNIRRDMTTNLPLETSGPCGCVEVIKEFDDRGNVTKFTDELSQFRIMEYNEPHNMMTLMVDKRGNKTIWSYFPEGNLKILTNARNEITSWTYDQFGQMKTMTDALNHTWKTDYDQFGYPISSIDPLGNQTLMEYDKVGRLKVMTDPEGRKTTFEYDDLDRLKERKDPSGAITKFEYDANGNQTSMTDALGHTWTMSYDAKDRLRTKKYPLTASDNGVQREMKWNYNTDNELTSITSPSGRITLYTYDPRGQRKTITDPRGGVVKYDYNADRNLILLTDQRNNITLFTPDELDRTKLIRDPLGHVTELSYDPENNVKHVIDRLGRTTIFTYDKLNRVEKAEYVDAVVEYKYDKAGRSKRIDDTQSGFIEWTYDDTNRLKIETTPAGIVKYDYNKASQTTVMTAADRPPVIYGYDTAGRLETISQNLTGQLETFTYGYDILSRRRSLQRPNGITTTYDYDEVNRLKELKHQKGTDPAVEDFTYEFNKDDEVSAITSLFSLPKLPTAKTVSPADAANRIPNFGGASFSFDNMGQTTAKTDASGTTQYGWDTRGRLTQVTLPSGQVVSYGYDALRRRKSRTADGVTTQFLYEDKDVVLDIGSDGIKIDYMNGEDIDDKLRQSNAITGSLYFTQDQIGSTFALTSTNGSVVERQQYEAFGRSNGSSFTRYGFTGRERDSAIGLIYYRARWYDPQQGRFLSEDPIGFKAGMNFYTYAGNNPITGKDSSGLCQDNCCKKDIDQILEWYRQALQLLRIHRGRVDFPLPIVSGLISGGVIFPISELVGEPAKLSCEDQSQYVIDYFKNQNNVEPLCNNHWSFKKYNRFPFMGGFLHVQVKVSSPECGTFTLDPLFY